MAGRKITPKNPNDSREPLRFAPGDIVRAIEEVGTAGLTVYGVEITLTGALNISTQPPAGVIKRPATPRQESETVDETISIKKQA
jgi:hypothetical protein